MEWVKSINNAVNYMELNIKRELYIDEIANHIHISSFHLQRTFAILTGFTIGEYIRNRRLSLAGQDLLTTKSKIIDIALEYGYDSPESFSKAFTRFHGVSPKNARKPGTILKSFNRLKIKISLEGGSSMDYRIENKDSFKIIAKTKYVESETSSTEIPKFWNEYFELGLNNKVCPMIGVCAEQKSNSKNYLYGIGSEEKYVKVIPNNYDIIEIPAYKWVIFKCVGPMPNSIQNMWERIYTEWLPISNYELIPDYDIEYYHDGDTSSINYISEIWVPVKEK